ncbi:hypothetical protein DRP05_02775 [Archaeoglobales archaeon]|nr:MAG: hypothetical protein DRP05_02775 [Archaeoglobales archaeon]
MSSPVMFIYAEYKIFTISFSGGEFMANDKNKDTEKFRKHIDRAKPLVLDLVNEKRFLMRRAIQVLLEEKHSIWQNVSWNAIEELKKEGKLRVAKYPPRGNYPVWVFGEDLRINKIKDEIKNKYIPVYREFESKSEEMGAYAEKIIEAALTKARFITLSKEPNTKYFRGREYPGRSTLDFIAYKEGVFYGIEVKNRVSYPNFEKILTDKKKVADYHGIQFLLISRRLGPYGYELFKCGGMHLEFEILIWNPKYSSIAEKAKKMLGYPIECINEPPKELIEKLKEIPKLHDKHFYGIGKI